MNFPRRLLLRDHPRVCGEKRESWPTSTTAPGSPPRMRGKGQRLLAKNPEFGITPAYAGKRRKSMNRNSEQQDHPRVCGEKHVFAGRYIYFVGSPPRMRGKDLLPALCGVVPGITPAYAGKSRIPSNAPTRFGDHPRVCGEKSTTSEDAGSLPGSPPRMRGKV